MLHFFFPHHTQALLLPQACSCTTPVATAVSLIRTFSSAHGPGARTGQHSLSSVLSHLLVFRELLVSSCLQEEGTEEPMQYRVTQEAGQTHLGSLCALPPQGILPPSLPLEGISVLLTCCQLLQQKKARAW